MALAIIFESVGAGEWLVLLAVLLVVVGPKRLPSTARKFGQYYSKFRRAAEGFKRQLLEMDTEITNAVREAENEVEQAAKDVDPDLAPPDPSEYGGFDENYADYGGYDTNGSGSTDSSAESKPSEKPAAAEVKPADEVKRAESETAKAGNGIKITVSPAPRSADSKKAKS